MERIQQEREEGMVQQLMRNKVLSLLLATVVGIFMFLVHWLLAVDGEKEL